MRRVLAVMVAGAFALAACGDDGGGSVEAFCESVERFVAFDDGSPDEADSENIAEARDITDALAANAPGEISDDVDTTTDGFDAFLDAVESADEIGEEAADEAIEALFADPEIEAASGRVNDFALAECGVDMDGVRR